MDRAKTERSEHKTAGLGRESLTRQQKVMQLWKSPLPAMTNVFSAVILVGLLQVVSPDRPLVVWLGLMTSIVMVRLYLWKRYRLLQPLPRKAHYWGRLYAVLSGLTAVLWGASAWFIGSFASFEAHVILAFVIAGMGAGAVVANSVYLPALFAYLLPSGAPLVMVFLARGEFTYLVMALMMALLIVLLSAIGLYLNRLWLSNFNLLFDNTELVEELTGARDQLHQTVEERTAELAQEIAERRQTETGLRQALQDAELANRAKSEFLANMNHELRTPLNSIIGFAEIIKDETFGPDTGTSYRKYGDHIYCAGQRLLEMINDIMDLARIESGEDMLHEEPIEVPKMVRPLLCLMKERAERAGVLLALECAKELPTLWADGRKLKQILTHLLSNAIKFTNPGGQATLKVCCESDGAYVIQVTDTGMGIAAADLPKVFAPFAQADGKLGRKHEGIGLGLPLAKSLVEVHGGSLELQSKRGVGTSVTVRLPAERSRPRKQVPPPSHGQQRKVN